MTPPALREALLSGSVELGLALSDAQADQLLGFVAMLEKWNRVYNLTSVRNPADMLTQHLLDSLTAVPPLQRHVQEQAAAGQAVANLLDVGSGGGLPGVVLAICFPALAVQCVDAVSKKAAFVQQVAASLGLNNLRGVHARVESLLGPFDVISSRAFASLFDFTAWSQQGLAPHGVWMAMKGKHPEAELAALPASVQVFHVEQLHVPGLEAERCMVWMRLAPSHVN